MDERYPESLTKRFETLCNDPRSGQPLGKKEILYLGQFVPTGTDVTIALNQTEARIDGRAILAEKDASISAELRLRREIAFLDNRVLRTLCLLAEALDDEDMDTYSEISSPVLEDRLYKEAVRRVAEYALRFFPIDTANWLDLAVHFFFRTSPDTIDHDRDFIFPPLRFAVDMRFDPSDIGDRVLSLADDIKRQAEALAHERSLLRQEAVLSGEVVSSVVKAFPLKERK